MGFDKEYPNRKDHRKPYVKSKRFDKSCRNHGMCSWCQNDRGRGNLRSLVIADEKLKEHKGEDHG